MNADDGARCDPRDGKRKANLDRHQGNTSLGQVSKCSAADPRRTKGSFDISARHSGFELVSSCVRRRVDGERSSSWRGSSRLQISGDAAPISVARRFGRTTGPSILLTRARSAAIRWLSTIRCRFRNHCGVDTSLFRHSGPDQPPALVGSRGFPPHVRL